VSVEELFARGPHPVGVRTIEVAQPGRSASIPAEVWYPAAAGVAVDAEDEYDLIPGMITGQQQAARDAPAASTPARLILFSHGLAGHRRQSTFLTTHLASHGYVVAAPDHVGNTFGDLFMAFAAQDFKAIETASLQSAIDRPDDVVATLDAVAGLEGLDVDAHSVGVCGHSFGGWTALQVVGREPRVAAVVGLAAGGGRVGDDVLAAEALELDWGRPVPTLLVAAELDTILPLEGMHDLFGRVPDVTALVVLPSADHYHFCDDAEGQHELVRSLPHDGAAAMLPFAELCPAADSEALIRGLTRAQFDRVLRGGGADVESVVAGARADAKVYRR
jgi:predicted dienelactone hydrolase